MGYKLTSLIRLPAADDIEMYIFLVGGREWRGGMEELIEKNFDEIAAELGEDAVIVGGLTEEFRGEVLEAYLGQDYSELADAVPALLLTDSHPDDLTDESFRYLLPLRQAQRSYEFIEVFFDDLIAFSKKESDELLMRVKDAPTAAELLAESIDMTVPVVPGVSINPEPAVARLRDWYED